MRKLKFGDIVDIAEYEKRRPEFRRRIMQIKDQRRIDVGPFITYLFETIEMQLYQVQEMMRSERIVHEEMILKEMEVYNELIPEHHQLSASVFIAIEDRQELQRFVTRAIDLPDHTYLLVDKNRIVPTFDSRQISVNRLSAIQYITYQLSPEQVEKFAKADSRVFLGFDHPLYTHEVELTMEQRETLHGDMIRLD